MDLFVINRHQEEKLNEEDSKLQEEHKIEKLLKKIERNKKIRSRQKERKKALKRQKTSFEKFEQQTATEKLPEVKENAYAGINSEQLNENGERPKKKKKINKESHIENFTVLGSNSFQKKTKVKRRLPRWLSHPIVIPTDLQNLQLKVSQMKQLDKGLRQNLKKNGIKHFFPVQAVVIPWLLEEIKNSSIMFPRDICVSAPTGSGKTLAFVLPIIHTLKAYTVKKIRALIILPTQDLAMQVFKTFRTYAAGTDIDTVLITGKNPINVEQKQLVVENEAFGCLSKADILVCTAGRLVDHLNNTKGFNLQDLEFLVIDEADRLLDSIQNDWLYYLEKHIQAGDTKNQATRVLNLITLQQKRPPQKLLFSATLSQDPEKLRKLSLFQPKLFTSIVEKEEEKSATDRDSFMTSTFVGKYTTPKELTERYIVCSLYFKPLVLYEFIRMENLTRTLIFTNSAESVHRLTLLLDCMFKGEKNIKEMPSNVDMNTRNMLMRSFANGEIDLFICTDRLARGMDLAGVQCVISYGAPKYLKTYIHRAGRTARAGQAGLAVTLLHNNQLNKFQTLLQQAEKGNLEEIAIDENKLHPLADQYQLALAELRDAIFKEEEENLKKIKLKKRPKGFKSKTKNLVSNSNSFIQ